MISLYIIKGLKKKIYIYVFHNRDKELLFRF